MSNWSLRSWGVSTFGALMAVSGCSGDSPSNANPADNTLPSQEGGAPDTSAAADAASETICSTTTCAKAGVSCGTLPDGCGGVLDCGNCPNGTSCGGNGANRCGTQACSARTCAQMGASCGYVSDGCSAALYCGDCVSPLSCGGGGVENTCGQPGAGGDDGSAGGAGDGGTPEETWCSYEVSPATGYPSTPFGWVAKSNGTSCEWSVDGVIKGSCFCNFDDSLLGSELGVGAHTTVFHVRQGPGGPKDCAASVEVKDETTCGIVFTPSSGFLTTDFALQTTSNGTSCELVFDGVSLGDTGCNAETILHGGEMGLGTHKATLKVQGPSGPKECSATAEVKQNTWCTFAVSPSSGSLTTSFSFDASSNGTVCKWTLDGNAMGSVDCNFDGNFPGSWLGIGKHNAMFKVIEGPSGPQNCPASVTVH